jgi:seryl-tRNA synthetase
MIDIQLLRKDIDAVAARLAQRKFQLDVAGFNALEAERKSIQTRTEELQGQRNSLSKQIGILKGKGEDSTEVMNQVASIADELKASADKLEIIQIYNLQEIENLIKNEFSNQIMGKT